MAASEKDLSDLHALFTKELTKQLKGEEDVPAAIMSVISKFLKDNGVQCTTELTEELQELRKASQEKQRSEPKFDPGQVQPVIQSVN